MSREVWVREHGINVKRALPAPRPPTEMHRTDDGVFVRVGDDVWSLSYTRRHGVPTIELLADGDEPVRWASLTDDGDVVKLDDQRPWTAGELRALTIAMREWRLST